MADNAFSDEFIESLSSKNREPLASRQLLMLDQKLAYRSRYEESISDIFWLSLNSVN